MSQSPWNEAHGDIGDSVQSLILKELGPHFNAGECKFMGSGREDVDVRMLGEVCCSSITKPHTSNPETALQTLRPGCTRRRRFDSSSI